MTTKDQNLPTTTDSGNDAVNLHVNLATMIVRSVSQSLGLSKPLQFGLCIDMGLSAETSGKIVGYKPRYSYELRRKFKNNRDFRRDLAEVTSMLPEWYRSACKARLPLLLAAEAQAIEKYLESPELLIDKPQLAKQIKRAAGVRTDEEQRTQFITINAAVQIQNIMKAQQDAHTKGEVIEIKSEEKA